MNITFVLPPVGMSGGIRVIAIYAQLLARRGHGVVVVSPPPRTEAFAMRVKRLLRLEQPTIRKSHLDHRSIDHRILDRWRPVTDLDVPDADVVVATWWETAEWVKALGQRKGAKIYFVQGHEVWSGLPAERSRATYHLGMHKIAVSPWLARIMASEYGDTAVDVVPNGVDQEQFFADPRGRQSTPTVGFLFSTFALKGATVAIEVIDNLRRQWPDLRVVSFGMDAMERTLRQRIEYHRDPAQHRLREIYASCDLWISASRGEGFNLPVMEAMACRTPVVATRTGWPADALTSKVNGVCVDIDDVSGLTGAAAWVLGLPDAGWRSVSEAAFATVRGSSWERSAELFEQSLLRAQALGA